MCCNQYVAFKNIVSFIQLSQLTLSSNWWQCECEFVRKFRKFIDANIEAIPDANNIKCTSSRLGGGEVDDAQQYQKKCRIKNACFCRRTRQRTRVHQRFHELRHHLVQVHCVRVRRGYLHGRGSRGTCPSCRLCPCCRRRRCHGLPLQGRFQDLDPCQIRLQVVL